MTLVDSSVWIDYFRGSETRGTQGLGSLLGVEPLLIGDRILVEVLQGFPSEKQFRQARKLLEAFSLVELGGYDVAVRAAKNDRVLQSKGVTVRKTIDTVIATRCIYSGYTLLHDDRDFDPFVQHLGLEALG